MPESKIKTPKGRTDLGFDLGVTLAGDVHVPVEVFLVYPEGHGLHAVKALKQAMAENVNALYQELLNRGDKSLVDLMLANGAEYEEEA